MLGNESLSDANRHQDELKAVQALIASSFQRLNNMLANELSRPQEQDNSMVDATQTITELQQKLALEKRARRVAEARNVSRVEQIEVLRSRNASLQQEIASLRSRTGVSFRAPSLNLVSTRPTLVPRSSLLHFSSTRPTLVSRSSQLRFRNLVSPRPPLISRSQGNLTNPQAG
jgi:hypothetical protein